MNVAGISCNTAPLGPLKSAVLKTTRMRFCHKRPDRRPSQKKVKTMNRLFTLTVLFAAVGGYCLLTNEAVAKGSTKGSRFSSKLRSQTGQGGTTLSQNPGFPGSQGSNPNGTTSAIKKWPSPFPINAFGPAGKSPKPITLRGVPVSIPTGPLANPHPISRGHFPYGPPGMPQQ
jgi:hypothetical protein